MSKEALRQLLREQGQDLSDSEFEEFRQFKAEMESEPVKPQRSSPSPKKSGKKKSGSRLSKKTNVRATGIPLDFPLEDEAEFWVLRCNKLTKMEKRLDLQCRGCLSVESRSKKCKEEPLYLFNTGNWSDPYRCAKKIHGSFIHPPRHNCRRNRTPIYKKEVCYPPPHFNAEFRRNEAERNGWIPSAENRRDDFRWRLREKMQYSHPDYRDYA